MMMIPGIIAYHLYGDGLETMDLAYPALISELLPPILSGFFLAVLLGAVFSSFNSLLNSAATMFVYDLYKVKIKKDASDREMIRVSKWFGTLLALVSFFIAPLLLRAPDGLWNIIREFTGFFNIPVIAIILVGIFSKYIPPIGAKIAIVVHVVLYYMLIWGFPMFFGFSFDISFIHIQGILFALAVLIMMISGFIRPLDAPHQFTHDPKVDMLPWKFAVPVTVLLMGAMVFCYILFSPIGLSYADGIVSGWFWPATIALMLLILLLWIISYRSWNGKYSTLLQEMHKEKKL
jgi:SSS family solute:Na+ symporter